MLDYRLATIDDLPTIVRLLADDFLGQQRERLEDPLPQSYGLAFREIDADPNNELIVAVLDYIATVSVAMSAKHESGGEPGPTNDSCGRDASEKLAVQSRIVGTMQLTFTPSISFQGGRRATVESVRVDSKYRGRGIGRQMMLWAIERAKQRGCISMQLTTNLERKDAHRFYENLGFTASHVGMKLKLR